MTWLYPYLKEVQLWLPSALIILAVNAAVALLGRPLGRLRWLVAAFVLFAPALLPQVGSYEIVELGMLSTILTSLAIVSAARLPDWDQMASRESKNRLALFAWLSLPLVRASLSALPFQDRAKLAFRYFAKALAKRLGWEVCNFIGSELGELPWALRSTLTILYFVLNLTAFHDLVLGLCVMSGLSADELFDAPLLSRSPRDFWSRRWNKFVNRFALKYGALKVRHRFSPFFTLLLVFACSGLFHEYFAWGVGGAKHAPGAMLSFFILQAIAVWFGSRWPLLAPWWVTQPLTFVWMIITAPLFFIEIVPALLAFGYPSEWLPLSTQMFWGW